jgi:hypothetical protein
MACSGECSGILIREAVKQLSGPGPAASAAATAALKAAVEASEMVGEGEVEEDERDDNCLERLFFFFAGVVEEPLANTECKGTERGGFK